MKMSCFSMSCFSRILGKNMTKENKTRNKKENLYINYSPPTTREVLCISIPKRMLLFCQLTKEFDTLWNTLGRITAWKNSLT